MALSNNRCHAGAALIRCSSTSHTARAHAIAEDVGGGMKKTAARPDRLYNDTIIQMTQDYCFIYLFDKGCGH
jgi:hypothetical protein